jgi:hypothetical protein
MMSIARIASIASIGLTANTDRAGAPHLAVGADRFASAGVPTLTAGLDGAVRGARVKSFPGTRPEP